MTQRFPPFYYQNKMQITNFINKCELEFATQIRRAADLILNSSTGVFGLAGPTCSGKTTTASMLKSICLSHGKHLHIVSTDDFYLERDYLIEHSRSKDGRIDFDSIETINLNALKKSLDGIYAGTSVEIPMFDFKLGKAVDKRIINVGADDLFLLEGIHAITPEVASLLPGEAYTGIYIDVDMNSASCESHGKICADGRTVRLARRLLRDYRFRSASPEFTLSLWENVVNGEKNGLEPYKDACKIKINSYLGYELSILKEPLENLLLQIPHDSVFYSQREKLEKLIEHVHPIGENFVPKDSVFREFIG